MKVSKSLTKLYLMVRIKIEYLSFHHITLGLFLIVEVLSGSHIHILNSNIKYDNITVVFCRVLCILILLLSPNVLSAVKRITSRGYQAAVIGLPGQIRIVSGTAAGVLSVLHVAY